MNIAPYPECSNGPVTTMPGDFSAPPEGARCDNHLERDAARRVQGETDSFGCEWLYLCAECVAGVAEHIRLGRSGRCAWCKQHADDLKPRRDYDEGMAGPVYEVCGECVRKDNEHAAAELTEYGDDYWPDDQ